MARGLSALQRWLLLRALENIDTGDVAETGRYHGHVTRSEVKADYYKMPMRKYYGTRTRRDVVRNWGYRAVRGVGHSPLPRRAGGDGAGRETP